jgi:hypothetical protein
VIETADGARAGIDTALAWREAAARLVQGLRAAENDAELRLSLLKRLARRFGELGYPGFIKLLLTVAQSDEAQAKRLLADAFALGLRRMDIPSGQLTSWGGGNVWPALQQEGGGVPAHRLGSAYYVNAAPRRQLGPLEYLTVWFCQYTQRPYLGEPVYRETLAQLVALMDCSAEARRLYPLKIRSDLDAAAEGTYTRQTRERLRALSEAWIAGASGAQVATAAASSAPPASEARQRLLLLPHA